jgi:hypothetical protein
MASKIFKLILRHLHFNGNTADTNTDCLYKIQPVLDILTEKLKMNYFRKKTFSACSGYPH